MPKLKKYGRMSEGDKAAVLQELARWARGELGSRLTWAVLEERFHFTRAAMSAKPEIKHAFQAAKKALAELPASREEAGEDIEALQRQVEELRREVAECRRREALWRERWQRIAFHIRQQGMQVDRIDRPATGDLPGERKTAEILRPFDSPIPPSGRRQ
jgi:hypothetical protein